jgi:hypothetical protein
MTMPGRSFALFGGMGMLFGGEGVLFGVDGRRGVGFGFVQRHGACAVCFNLFGHVQGGGVTNI